MGKNAEQKIMKGNVYVNIKNIDDNSFYAWDFNGFREIVDTKSGKLLASDFFNDKWKFLERLNIQLRLAKTISI